MEKMTISSKSYYLATAVKKKHSDLFKGCSQTIRDVISRQRLKRSEYLYAHKVKNEWKIDDESYIKELLDKQV
jgi:hypothetical protein